MTHPEISHQDLRRRYSDEALRGIPKLLLLIDRNLYSPTYGCFDRSYWHYRTMDFPCGMSQEFCLPLALVYKHPFPDNPYHRVERVKELALAGIDFARRSSHSNGSCDDYFPNEQALGAAVFSLYAMTETCLVLQETRPEDIEFFARRGKWLLSHNESGRLSNHQAFAALALQNVYELTGDARFAKGRDEYLGIVSDWQSPEGWFQEYEGADPGYQTCTISFLGKLLKKCESQAERGVRDSAEAVERLLSMLVPGVEFCWYFMHPDGSYGGEYGSRNTYHFYPHGFEIMAAIEPKAGQIADHFLLRTLPSGTRYYNDDDRMCAHYLYDWLQAYLDFHPEKPDSLNSRPNFRKFFAGAGLLVQKTDHYYAVCALNKGGVLKVSDEAGPLYSDTGLIGRLSDGRVLVSHLVDDYETSLHPQDEADPAPALASSGGNLNERRTKLGTPFKIILFRLLNLTLGRFFPDLMRRFLQKILITGKPRTNFRFGRSFRFLPDRIEIENRVERPEGEPEFHSLHIGSDATSIYVANSNVYQRSVLTPWRDWSEVLAELNQTGAVTWRLTVPGRKVSESDAQPSLAQATDV